MTRQFIVFCVTGVLATLSHVLVASVFVVLFGIGATIANGAAFCAALSISYVGNTLVGFRVKPSSRTGRRFALVSVAGFALTLVLSGIIDAIGYHFLVGITAVVLTIPMTTFWLHRAWTYRA